LSRAKLNLIAILNEIPARTVKAGIFKKYFLPIGLSQKKIRLRDVQGVIQMLNANTKQGFRYRLKHNESRSLKQVGDYLHFNTKQLKTLKTSEE